MYKIKYVYELKQIKNYFNNLENINNKELSVYLIKI